MIVALSRQARENARENARVRARAHVRACVCLRARTRARACVRARVCECMRNARACSLLQGDSDMEASLLLTRAHRQCAEGRCDLRGPEAEPHATCMFRRALESRQSTHSTAHIGHCRRTLASPSRVLVGADRDGPHVDDCCRVAAPVQHLQQQRTAIRVAECAPRQACPQPSQAATAGSVRHWPFRVSQISWGGRVGAPLYQRVAAEQRGREHGRRTAARRRWATYLLRLVQPAVHRRALHDLACRHEYVRHTHAARK